MAEVKRALEQSFRALVLRVKPNRFLSMGRKGSTVYEGCDLLEKRGEREGFKLEPKRGRFGQEKSAAHSPSSESTVDVEGSSLLVCLACSLVRWKESRKRRLRAMTALSRLFAVVRATSLHLRSPVTWRQSCPELVL